MLERQTEQRTSKTHEKESSGDAQTWVLFDSGHTEDSILRLQVLPGTKELRDTGTKVQENIAGSQSVQCMQRVRVTQK